MDFQNWIARLGSEIIPLEINYFQARPTSGTDKHVHPGHLHVACFEKGTGTCLVNGVTHRIRSGDVYLIFPGEMHQFTPNAEQPYLACFLHFSWYGELPTDLPPNLRVPARERKRFFRFCRQLSEELRSRAEIPGGEFFFAGSLLHFWGLLYSYAGASGKTHTVSRPSTGIDKLLNPIIEKLHGPPFNYPGIDALAEENRLSRRRLTQLFRQYVGCGIKQYYLSNLMHYAWSVRRQKTMTTAELARRCGYSTVQNFLLAYKKYFAEHPMESAGEVRLWHRTGETLLLPDGRKKRIVYPGFSRKK